jgi:hypothetical protein
VSRERPINADEPTQDAAAEAQGEKKSEPGESKPAEASPPASKTKRRPIPAALKLIGATVLVAIVFLVAAIVGGGGGEPPQPDGPAPVPAGGETTAPSAEEEPAQQAPTELGYPAFATANTTRIGGSDPASNAAAAALAVFPSIAPTQHPAAVTLVDEGDWEAALAAAVLMAEPLRAPVLFSTPDGTPDPTSEALGALDPQGSADSGGASAFAIGEVDDAGVSGRITRVAGRGAAAAAAIAALRDRLFGKPPKHFLIAPSDDPAFAMPAAAWAARSGDPVLFAGREVLPEATVAALKRHPKLPVYLLGPHTAISAEVARQIAKAGGRVHRISAEDPIAGAVAFARYVNGSFGWNVNDPGHGFVVARSESTLDAAAAAPLSAAGTWGPLLLTDSATALPPALHDYLLDVKPGYTTDPTRAFYNHVWVIGDQAAIDVAQQAQINELAELAKIGGEE